MFTTSAAAMEATHMSFIGAVRQASDLAGPEGALVLAEVHERHTTCELR
jgi:hypothetical protein